MIHTAKRRDKARVTFDEQAEPACGRAEAVKQGNGTGRKRGGAECFRLTPAKAATKEESRQRVGRAARPEGGDEDGGGEDEERPGEEPEAGESAAGEEGPTVDPGELKEGDWVRAKPLGGGGAITMMQLRKHQPGRGWQCAKLHRYVVETDRVPTSYGTDSVFVRTKSEGKIVGAQFWRSVRKHGEKEAKAMAEEEKARREKEIAKESQVWLLDEQGMNDESEGTAYSLSGARKCGAAELTFELAGRSLQGQREAAQRRRDAEHVSGGGKKEGRKPKPADGTGRDGKKAKEGER